MATLISAATATLWAKLTGTDNGAVKRVKDLDDRNGNPSTNARLGTLVKTIAEAVTLLNAGQAVELHVAIPSGPLGAAGTDIKFPGLYAKSALQCTSARVIQYGAATADPAAGANNCVLEVLKNASTVVATKTFVAAIPTNAFTEMTLGVDANTKLAAGDSLAVRADQNGTTNIGNVAGSSGLVFSIQLAPYA